MHWFRRIFTFDPEASWCDGVDPSAVTSYEGAVSLIPCAIEPGEHARQFAERIDSLLAGLPVSRVSHLDRSIRVRSSWNSGGWSGQTTLRAVLPEHLPEHRELFLCMALCHRSGYVRQEAICEVASKLQQDAFAQHAALAMQLLVLRRNDWVAPVADEAAQALGQLMAKGPAACWVAALPLLVHLSHVVRRDHADFVESVRVAARSAAWGRLLMEGLRCSDREVARSATRFALRNRSLTPIEVVSAALDVADDVVRFIAARAASKVTDVRIRASLVACLEDDVFMPVRRESLRLRAQWFPETLVEAHRRCLFDPSRSLRAQAQAAMSAGGDEPVAYYRTRLNGTLTADAATALLGLGEVGREIDAQLAERFTAASTASCRAAAIRCLARLNADSYGDRFVAALRDSSGLVSRAAATGLRGRVHIVGVGRLLALLDEAPRDHVRRVVLRLLFEGDQWASLAPLVRCVAAGDTEHGLWARSLLRAWFKRYPGWSSPPPKSHVDALRSAMADCGAKLGGEQRRELEFLMNTL